MYKVMLVDDEYLDLLGLERFVPWQEYNMEVVAALKSGFEAGQLIRNQPVDLLVTDIRMPQMSGLELAEQARALYPHLKIIFVSGHQDFEYARKALSIHATGYVLKPINDEELFQQLRLVKLQLDQEQERNDLVLHITNLEQKLVILFNAIAENDAPSIHTVLQDLFGYIAPLHNRDSVYGFALFLLSKLSAYLQPLNENLDTLLRETPFSFDNLRACKTIEEIKSWLYQLMDFIADYLYRKRQKRNHKIIQEIEQYINEHLGEDITLREVAQQVGFSPNYLGLLFKEKTGESFTEYATRKRLEKARQLLRDPKLKLHEIAYQLGYHNLTYFGRQFKEYFGQTPSEFRRQL